MPEAFYAKLCILLAATSISFMLSAGALYKLFVVMRHQNLTQETRMDTIKQSVMFMRAGMFGLLVSILSFIFQWYIS